MFENFWETLLITSIVILVYSILIYVITNRRNYNEIKQGKKQFDSMIESLKIGDHVMFGSGLIGEVLSIEDNYLDIKLTSGTVTISKYAISSVLDKQDKVTNA